MLRLRELVEDSAVDGVQAEVCEGQVGVGCCPPTRWTETTRLFRVMDQRQVSHGGPVFERRTIGVGGAISPCGAVTVKVSGVDTRLRVARQIIGIETGTWRFVHVRDCNTFHLRSGPLDLTVGWRSCYVLPWGRADDKRSDAMHAADGVCGEIVPSYLEHFRFCGVSLLEHDDGCFVLVLNFAQFVI